MPALGEACQPPSSVAVTGRCGVDLAGRVGRAPRGSRYGCPERAGVASYAAQGLARIAGRSSSRRRVQEVHRAREEVDRAERAQRVGVKARLIRSTSS